MIIPFSAWAAEKIVIPVGGQESIFYQAAPLSDPAGGEQFRGSNFIHPLKTPSGFTVTDSQPKDHMHHFGVWWPWKFIEYEGRKILCWELQKGDGLVQAKETTETQMGLTTKSVYLDRKAGEEPVPRLEETTVITNSPLSEQSHGYHLDLEITHQVVGDQPITISKYRYSGFAFRGSALWNKDTSTILTSEGKDRDAANFTKARWIRAEGKTDSDARAGVLLMGHPSNHNHPEKLRTWDKQHHGAVFINFNPVMDESWTFEPDKKYTRRYRIYVYDGKLTAEEAESLWKAYASQ